MQLSTMDHSMSWWHSMSVARHSGALHLQTCMPGPIELLCCPVASPTVPDVPLQAFPTVTHLIIRAGADDTTLATIGNNLTTLRHLELYNLAVGYSRSGLKGIAHLETLRSLVLQVWWGP